MAELKRYRDRQNPNSSLVLLVAKAATGDSVSLIGGDFFWTVDGTWDSATAQLQWSPNNGTTWIDIDGAVLTANGGFSHIGLATGDIRVALSGAGGSTSLNSRIQPQAYSWT